MDEIKARILKAVKVALGEGAGVRGRFSIVGTDSRTGELRNVVHANNIVLSSADRGLDLILDRLAGTNTYSLNLSHCDIGTSATAPTEADTGLIAGVARAAKVDATITGKQVVLRFFWADADLANGTYHEIAAYIDGNATLGNGRPFNRAIFGSGYTKGSNTDTTVELTITLSN